MTWFYTIVSVIVVSLISLVGVLTLAVRKEKLEHILLYLVSFSVGALFGDVFLHIIPEISDLGGWEKGAGWYLLLGIVLFFIIEKFVHWHHCHKVDHAHDHDLMKPLAVTVLIGDAFHNFLDGAIIAGSFLVSFPLGLATTLAVIFHEIPDELGHFGVLLYTGMKSGRALWFNFLSALTAILGAVVTLLAARQIEGLEIVLLAIAGGGFIYIAGSDLIPELHKGECRSCRAVYQLIAILLGVGLMGLMLLLE